MAAWQRAFVWILPGDDRRVAPRRDAAPAADKRAAHPASDTTMTAHMIHSPVAYMPAYFLAVSRWLPTLAGMAPSTGVSGRPEGSG